MLNEVAQMKRGDLLKDKPNKEKDPQTIFVCDWHPNLSSIPSILKRNFHIIESHPDLAKIFPSKMTVAYRRPRAIKDYIVRNNSLTEQKITSTSKCGKCKLCKNLSTKNIITNKKKNITVNIKHYGNCRTQGVIYAACCKKHDVIYVGHTGESLNDRFSKHRYDIKKRPENSELAAHFHKDHTEDDMEVFILQTNLLSEPQRELFEDKWICRLQTLANTGINVDIHQYGKEMYTSYSKATS